MQGIANGRFKGAQHVPPLLPFEMARIFRSKLLRQASRSYDFRKQFRNLGRYVLSAFHANHVELTRNSASSMSGCALAIDSVVVDSCSLI